MFVAQVLVYKDDGDGHSRRVYRQSWSGELKADFYLASGHNWHTRLMVLEKCRPSGGHVLIRMGSVMGHQDFSIEHITSPWVLGNRLAEFGVSHEMALKQGFLLPIPEADYNSEEQQRLKAKTVKALRAARPIDFLQRGETSLPAPYSLGRIRAVSLSPAASFRILATVASPDDRLPFFVGKHRTHHFLVLPVSALSRGDYDIQYLLCDQPGRLKVVNSACRYGYTSFGVASMFNEQHATEVMYARGVKQQWLKEAGLWSYTPRLQAETKVEGWLKQIASGQKLKSE